MSLCLEQGSEEWCQRRRGPRSSYDVMSGRSILGFWAQMMGLWGQSCHTWCCLHTTWSSWHTTSHLQLQLCKLLKQGLACLNRGGNYTHAHTLTQGHTHKHVPVLKHINKQKQSWTDTAKSLTIALLSILRDFVTRLTFDAFERTLCVFTYSLGACSRKCALINICHGTTHTVRQQQGCVYSWEKNHDENGIERWKAVLNTHGVMHQLI